MQWELWKKRLGGILLRKGAGRVPEREGRGAFPAPQHFGFDFDYVPLWCCRGNQLESPIEQGLIGAAAIVVFLLLAWLAGLTWRNWRSWLQWLDGSKRFDRRSTLIYWRLRLVAAIAAVPTLHFFLGSETGYDLLDEFSYEFGVEIMQILVLVAFILAPFAVFYLIGAIKNAIDWMLAR